MPDNLIRKSGEFNVIEKSASGTGYTFVISSEAPDLVNDVVVQKGIKPVSERVVAQIDHSGQVMDSIGHWENIRLDKTGKKTLADLVPYPDDINHAPSKLVKALLDKGIRMAASIGFRGNGELRDSSKGYSGGMLYKESSLLEVSVVNVPCHPEALSVAKSLNMPKNVVDMVIEQDRNDDYLIQKQMRVHDALSNAAKILG